MSPTRRDIIKAAAGIGLAALPFTTSTPTPADSGPAEFTEPESWWLDYFRRQIENGELRGITLTVRDGVAKFSSKHGYIGFWGDDDGGHTVVMQFNRPISEDNFGTMLVVPLINIEDK